jgi:Mg2+-importing ATPase
VRSCGDCSPLSLILLAAGIVSAATGDGTGGTIIVAILVLSIGLDTFQEGRAVKAAEVLRRSVALKAEVRRDGAFVSVEVDTVVPGDVVRVRAGDIIPADALVLEATAFTASEAALTGEALSGREAAWNRCRAQCRRGRQCPSSGAPSR